MGGVSRKGDNRNVVEKRGERRFRETRVLIASKPEPFLRICKRDYSMENERKRGLKDLS